MERYALIDSNGIVQNIISLNSSYQDANPAKAWPVPAGFTIQQSDTLQVGDNAVS